MRKYFSVFIAASIGHFCLSRAAAAADLHGLAEFVRPAYTAMNFAAVCVRDNPNFLSDSQGPRGTAFDYAQHVKDEAIDGLSPGDAAAILRSAADAARATVRAKLHELARPGDRAGTVQAIIKWCDGQGKSFILDFLRHHDSVHSEVEEFLRRAKQ